MRNLKLSIMLIVLLNWFNISAQWSIQTGYDFGTFSIRETNQKNFNSLHRLTSSGEYALSNQIFFSLNSGLDLHFIEYASGFRLSTPSGQYSIETFSFNKMNIQNLRIGVSFGYFIKINSSSSIQMKINYDQYFVSNVSIIESYRKESFYDVPSEEIDINSPFYTVYDFSPRIDFERFGYRNKFVKENRNIIFSFGYRYHIGDYFVSPSVGFSPLNNGFVLSRGQNLLLFGVNFGYTLPQKTKNHEK